MRVWIDQFKCEGDGICTQVAPDIFKSWDDGLTYVRIGKTAFLGEDGTPKFKGESGQIEIPPERLAAVEEAAILCPGRCIYIRDDS